MCCRARFAGQAESGRLIMLACQPVLRRCFVLDREGGLQPSNWSTVGCRQSLMLLLLLVCRSFVAINALPSMLAMAKNVHMHGRWFMNIIAPCCICLCSAVLLLAAPAVLLLLLTIWQVLQLLSRVWVQFPSMEPLVGVPWSSGHCLKSATWFCMGSAGGLLLNNAALAYKGRSSSPQEAP